MKTFKTLALAAAISTVCGTAVAGPLDGAASSLGLNGLLSTSGGLPSAVNSGVRGGLGNQYAWTKNKSTLVGVTAFEPDNRLNGDLVGASIGSGDNTGNGRHVAGAAVLAGKNSGHGGMVGVAALSEGNNGSGGVVSVRALNADEALALGLGGQDTQILAGPDLHAPVDALSGGDARPELRALLGRSGIGGAVETGLIDAGNGLGAAGSQSPEGLVLGDDSIAITAFGGNAASNSDFAGVAALSGNDAANGSVVNAAAITGDNSGNGGVASVAAITGDSSANNGTVTVAALTGENSGNGGWVNASAISGEGTARSEDAFINLGTLNSASPDGGIVGIGIANGLPEPIVIIDGPVLSDAREGSAAGGCSVAGEQVAAALPNDAGPQLGSRFTKPVDGNSSDGCQVEQTVASAR